MTAEPAAAASSDAAAAAPSSSSAAAPASSSIALPPNRFELELEFVQALASPAYLHHLATSGILYQPAFLDFLRYLRYWKRPEYAKYLLYPHCLYFLDLIVPPSSDPEDGNDGGKEGHDEGEAFRREMAQVPFRNFVHEQQFYSWQYRSARLYGRGEGQGESNEGGAGGEEGGSPSGDAGTTS